MSYLSPNNIHAALKNIEYRGTSVHPAYRATLFLDRVNILVEGLIDSPLNQLDEFYLKGPMHPLLASMKVMTTRPNLKSMTELHDRNKTSNIDFDDHYHPDEKPRPEDRPGFLDSMRYGIDWTFKAKENNDKGTLADFLDSADDFWLTRKTEAATKALENQNQTVQEILAKTRAELFLQHLPTHNRLTKYLLREQFLMVFDAFLNNRLLEEKLWPQSLPTKLPGQKA